MTKKLQIRNSTADFLVFTKENNSANTIEVRVQDGNVWLTQKAIGQLFDIDRSVVTKLTVEMLSGTTLQTFIIHGKVKRTEKTIKKYFLPPASAVIRQRLHKNCS